MHAQKITSQGNILFNPCMKAEDFNTPLGMQITAMGCIPTFESDSD